MFGGLFVAVQVIAAAACAGFAVGLEGVSDEVKVVGFGAEVAELLELGQQADQAELPEGLDISAEIAFRRDRLLNLSQAKAVLHLRAEVRYQAEMAEYEAKVREREAKEQETGRSRSGCVAPPQGLLSGRWHTGPGLVWTESTHDVHLHSMSACSQMPDDEAPYHRPS